MDITPELTVWPFFKFINSEILAKISNEKKLCNDRHFFKSYKYFFGNCEYDFGFFK